MVKEQVAALVESALQRCVKDGLLPPGEYAAGLDAPKQAAALKSSYGQLVTLADLVPDSKHQGRSRRRALSGARALVGPRRGGQDCGEQRSN